MLAESSNGALCAQLVALSSDKKILPSPNPKALLSRCESMYGPSGARRNQKSLVSRIAAPAARKLRTPGRTVPAAAATAAAATNCRRFRRDFVFIVHRGVDLDLSKGQPGNLPQDCS